MIPESPRVFVVEDDEGFRRSLGRLLKSHGIPVELFSSAEEFLGQLSADPEGCIVLDVSMPGLNGLELQQHLAEADCTMPIVFLTGRGDIPMCAQAIKQGAVDFLTKPVDENLLIGTLQKALAEYERGREGRAHLRIIRQHISTLTEREHEVMRHVIAGELNKQIGGVLGVAEKTIKVHRGRVMEKMRVASVAELVRDCALAGIVPA